MDYTPDEVAKLLAERPHQPHYIAAMIRKCIARAVREAVPDKTREAYAQGWMEAAHWTERADLFCDMDSPAYIKARDSRLRKIGAAPTQDQENGS